MKLFRKVWFSVIGLSLFLCCSTEDLPLIIAFGSISLVMGLMSIAATYIRR